MKIAML